MNERWERDDTLVYALTKDAKGRMVNRWYANAQSAGQPHGADALERCAIATKMQAAPDMLAALVLVADAWSRPATPSGYGRTVSDVVWDLRQAMPQVHAAIAKARGQGPSGSKE